MPTILGGHDAIHTRVRVAVDPSSVAGDLPKKVAHALGLGGHIGEEDLHPPQVTRDGEGPADAPEDKEALLMQRSRQRAAVLLV